MKWRVAAVSVVVLGVGVGGYALGQQGDAEPSTDVVEASTTTTTTEPRTTTTRPTTTTTSRPHSCPEVVHSVDEFHREARRGCNPELDLDLPEPTGPGRTPTTGLRVYCGGHGVMTHDECSRAFEQDHELEAIERRQRELEELQAELERCLNNPDSILC
jgi:hypothetical protein